ncbi:hypothetical protein DsansV1_C32g0223351 [Dioscorea sansibarensis]
MQGACFYEEDGAWTPWMVPLFVFANVAIFVASMYVNNCPGHDAPYGCVAGFLGRSRSNHFGRIRRSGRCRRRGCPVEI